MAALPAHAPCRFYPGCLYGATTYVEAFTFSIVTQMTIGTAGQGRLWRNRAVHWSAQ